MFFPLVVVTVFEHNTSVKKWPESQFKGFILAQRLRDFSQSGVAGFITVGMWQDSVVAGCCSGKPTNRDRDLKGER